MSLIHDLITVFITFALINVTQSILGANFTRQNGKLLAVAWHNGLHPSVPCVSTKEFGEWKICWPPVEKAIQENRCVVYSFGYADVDPFADSMAAEGCKVYAFDPGIDHPLNLKQNLEFRHWGLASGQKNENAFESSLYGKTDKGKYLSFKEI